jgi:hypothetical protein
MLGLCGEAIPIVTAWQCESSKHFTAVVILLA